MLITAYILMLISIFCVLLIGGSVIVHFITQSKSDNYGTRLERVLKTRQQKDIPHFRPVKCIELNKAKLLTKEGKKE